MNRKVVSLPSLIGCIVLVFLCAVVWIFLQKYTPSAADVNIYRGDTKLASFPLSEDNTFKIEDIGMTIEISKGSAYISQSSCRCKTCQSFGKLSKSGQTAICLPSQVRVELSGKSELDATL